MPSKEIIGANKIVDNQLPPHLRRKKKGKVINVNSPETDTNSVYITLGASINKYDPIFIDSDGLAYKADNVSKPCVAIALSSGVLNDVITIHLSGELTISDSFAPSSAIYIGNTILTDTPDISSGKILQRIGTMKANNVIFVSIREANYIE